MTEDSTSHTYSIIPGLNMGLFAPETLASIMEIINRYDVPATKITGAQRLALLGIKKDQIKEIQNELQPFLRETVANGVTYVQACPGKKWCRYGQADTIALGGKLEKLNFSEPFSAKVKVAVSGCRMCCTEPYLRDVGIYASKSGWTLIFGGNGGGRPRIGDVVAKKLSDNEVIDLTRKCLNLYRNEARPASRTSRFMERYGIEKLKEKVLR